MKNKTLLFLLLIFCFHLKSQDSTIAIVYGKEIKKESALIIGYPANSNEYSYISKYYFDNNFQKDVLSPMRENQASDTIYAIHLSLIHI